MMSSSEWYLVRTKPRQEALAAMHVRRQGHDVYFARTMYVWMAGGERRSRVVTMFPSYIFVAGWLATLRSTRGVLGPVYFGDQPATVRRSEIKAMRRREVDGVWLEDSCEAYSSFVMGQRVQRRDALGIELIFDRIIDARRHLARVMMKFMGGLVPAEIDARELVAV